MKKFEFMLKMGEKIIYHSIISFTEDQERSYLQEIKEQPGEDIETELENVSPEGKQIIPYIGERGDDWLEKNIDTLIREHPDLLIAAHIRSIPFDIGMFQNFPEDGNPICIPNEQQEIICSELLNYSWECSRIE